MIYYSKTTNGFYNTEFIKYDLPKDAVEITQTFYKELFDGQNEGKYIVPGDNGYPRLVDERTPVDEIEAARVRSVRDALLSADIDSLNPIRWAAMTPEKQKEWADYRSALLHVPQQAGFPNNVTWPKKPS